MDQCHQINQEHELDGGVRDRRREENSSVDVERWVTINQQDKKASGAFDQPQLKSISVQWSSHRE